jgi:prepilin-type N-terminal cleavage/methylation domain-containing protein
MNLTRHKTSAFTLIELLTVIAVIAILSGILIPVAGGVIKQSRIASSKARLWQYIIAVEQFKAEYNYYPFPSVYTTDTNSNGLIEFFGASNKSPIFVDALSGNGNVGGNYRSIQFYSFSENEFQDENSSTGQLSDSFNNTNISIMIDVDGDGIIEPDSDTLASPGQIRGNATAWVEANAGNPGYALWE